MVGYTFRSWTKTESGDNPIISSYHYYQHLSPLLTCIRVCAVLVAMFRSLTKDDCFDKMGILMRRDLENISCKMAIMLNSWRERCALLCPALFDIQQNKLEKSQWSPSQWWENWPTTDNVDKQEGCCTVASFLSVIMVRVLLTRSGDL